MKTKTVYQCERCGLEYNFNEEAQDCEDSHVDTSKLDVVSFEHEDGDIIKDYPRVLIVRDRDFGREGIYRRTGVRQAVS